MKKLFLLAGVFALILSSCTQDLPVADENADQEVIFTSNDLKGFKADLYDCANVAVYAKAKIVTPDGKYVTNSTNGNYEFTESPSYLTIPVFYVDGVMYTQAIKLPSIIDETNPGLTYTLEEFILFDADDNEVNAVPIAPSEYASMVSTPLPHDFVVGPFTKSEVPLSVLCYTPEDYEAFGFTWFRVTEEEITNKFFFGDFCTKFFMDYENSPYAGLIGVDMPAIFELTLYAFDTETSSWELLRTVDNLVEEGETGTSGHLLELIYPTDRLDDGDLFKIDVRILVKTGNDFEFTSFGSWFFEDESILMYASEEDLGNGEGDFGYGEDRVYDFILGNCNVNGADFVFAPYMNLPGGDVSGIDMTLTLGSDPDRYAYWTAVFSGLDGLGYDMENLDNMGTPDLSDDRPWATYCVDAETTMSPGVFEDIEIYSTLYVENLPTSVESQDIPWDHINWLINNLGSFSATPTWAEIQKAIWVIERNYTDVYPYDSPYPFNSITADADLVKEMVEAADDQTGFMPLPGQYAAVILHNASVTQAIFTIVDP